ncbi:hypothetical protein [Streptomyces sp. NPDC002520]
MTGCLPVYSLGLDDLRRGRELAPAQAVAWRYVVEQGGIPVALADTVVTPEGVHSVAQVNYGPFVSGILEALEVAEHAEGGADAELRLLQVPALHLLAIWLHRGASGQDRLVPAAPSPTGIEANHDYPATALLTELTARARTTPERAGDGILGG